MNFLTLLLIQTARHTLKNVFNLPKYTEVVLESGLNYFCNLQVFSNNIILNIYPYYYPNTYYVRVHSVSNLLGDLHVTLLMQIFNQPIMWQQLNA